MAAYNPKQRVDALSAGAAATSKKRVRFSTEHLGPTPSRPHVDEIDVNPRRVINGKPRLVNNRPRPVNHPRTSTPIISRNHRPTDPNYSSDSDSTDEIMQLCLAEEEYEKYKARQKELSKNKVQSQAATSSKPVVQGKPVEGRGNWNMEAPHGQNCKCQCKGQGVGQCNGQCKGLTAEGLDFQLLTAQRANNQRFRKALANQRIRPNVGGTTAKTSTAHFVDRENHNKAKELDRPKVTATVARSRHSAPSGPSRDLHKALDETYVLEWEEVIPHVYRQKLSRRQEAPRAPGAPRKPHSHPRSEAATDEESRMLQRQVDELKLKNKKLKENIAHNDGLLVFYCNEMERRQSK